MCGSEEETGRRGRLREMMRGRLSEAQQLQIIAWRSCLLYFLNSTKACLSWRENEEYIADVGDRTVHTFQGLESTENIFMKRFANSNANTFLCFVKI